MAASLPENVFSEVSESLEMLKSKARPELDALVENPRTWISQTIGKGVEFGAWAERHSDGRLAVIVEGRRSMLLGISQVIAKGFYLDPDDKVVEFVDADLWSHGY